MPVADNAQKWVVQLWGLRYKMFEAWNPAGNECFQGRTGQAINTSDGLPDGVSHDESCSQLLAERFTCHAVFPVV
jgi:hypothetical protein